LIKNSQPFGKNFQKTLGGIFFDSHCSHIKLEWCGYHVAYYTIPGRNRRTDIQKDTLRQLIQCLRIAWRP